MSERESEFKDLEEEQKREEESQSRWGDFKIFSKKMKEIYNDDNALSLRTEHSTVSKEIFRITSKALLESRIQNAYEDPNVAAELSRGLYSIDANYAKIIDYYSTMFFTRYITIPTQPVGNMDELSDEDYLVKYDEMMQVVDGLSLEIVLPKIIKETYLAGAAYLYAIKNNTSKTISFLMLPTKYSRTVLLTDLGTNLIEFNFEYFDQFRTEENLQQALNVFPKEFSSLYREVQTQNDKWVPLDPRYSTSLRLNERSLPPFLKAMGGIIDYEDFKEIEKTKNSNALKSLFVNRIPVWEDTPLFDLNEMKSIHAGLKRILKQHDGLQPITVFGDTELHQLQKTGEVENKAIDQSYKGIYNSVGINSAIVTGDSADSIKLMKSVDKSSVWDLITNINNFINVAVNNLYKFKPLQAEITLLPITVADADEQVKNYRENAAYGIGKLEAIVASGIKQKHIKDRARLETALDLDNILKPLQSSHTQSDLNSVTTEANDNVDNTDNVDDENV